MHASYIVTPRTKTRYLYIMHYFIIHTEKLQERCDSRILFRISGRMDPLSYVSHFALESEHDEMLQRCVDKDGSALSINLEMLFKWRKRIGLKATYQALLEIFQRANDEKMIDLVRKYAENGHSMQTFEFEKLKFPKVNNRKDIPVLEKKYFEITAKFEFLREEIIQSLEKTHRPEDLAYYLSNAHHFQFESTDDTMDIMAKTSSWFNIKVLKSLVNHYGTDENKKALSNYEQDLRAYLQQSLFNIPAQSFQNSIMSDVTMCYLKIADKDVNMLDLSGVDVLEIEGHLADYLEIPCEAFNLCEYRLGCIELVFSIPTTLYQSSFTLQKKMEPDRFEKDRDEELKLIVELKDIL